MSLAHVLPLFTSNVATVLKLAKKGHLQSGNDADVLVLRGNTLEIIHLFARGRQLVKDGQLVQLSKQEKEVEAGKE
jgi:beta-aspartyl-dipeptidase (metallo-type)